MDLLHRFSSEATLCFSVTCLSEPKGIDAYTDTPENYLNFRLLCIWKITVIIISHDPLCTSKDLQIRFSLVRVKERLSKTESSRDCSLCTHACCYSEVFGMEFGNVLQKMSDIFRIHTCYVHIVETTQNYSGRETVAETIITLFIRFWSHCRIYCIANTF